jgi:hypothetical protein
VLAVLCLAQGVRLQDHWGFQAVQFISLWLAWHLRGLGPKAAPRLLLLGLGVHGLALAIYSRPAWDPRALDQRGRPDQFYPAQALADAVLDEWKRHTPCPLHYVVGPTFEGGMISVYSGENPAIFEMGVPERSPWIDQADLKQAGAVYAYGEAPAQLPGPGPLHKLEFKRLGSDKSLYDVYWTIVPPVSCQ